MTWALVMFWFATILVAYRLGEAVEHDRNLR